MVLTFELFFVISSEDAEYKFSRSANKRKSDFNFGYRIVFQIYGRKDIGGL